jgi:hypothetical protein
MLVRGVPIEPAAARGWRRARALLICSALIGAVLPAADAYASQSNASPSIATASPPPVIPPDLAALEQKMGELRVDTARFNVKTAVSGFKLPHGLGAILSLLDLSVSGEASRSPSASNVTLKLAGHAAYFRQIGSKSYMYLPSFAPYDGGRPWIDTGSAEGGPLFGGSPGSLSDPVAGSQQEASPLEALTNVDDGFASLVKTVNKARTVSELGAGTVDGQSVLGFRAVLDPAAFEPKPSRRPAVKGRPRLRVSPVKRTLGLEVFIAADGLPVRTGLTETTTSGKGLDLRVTETIDLPEINFPLVIEAPPASQTITQARFAAIERKRHEHRRRHQK